MLLSVFIALQFPVVQTSLAREFAQIASKNIGAKVAIDRVSIQFFDRADFYGLYVEDLHHDTLLYLEKLEANFDNVYLGGKHIDFDRVKASHGKFNVRQLWNEDDLNIQFILDILNPPRSPEEKKIKREPEHIFFWKAELNDVDFTYEYRDSLPRNIKGMDYEHLQVRNINAQVNHLLIVDDSLSGSIKSLSAYEKSGFEVKNFESDFIISYNLMEFSQFKIKSAQSTAEGSVRFNYSSYQDLSYFEDSVLFNGTIKKSALWLDELWVFSEDLKGLNAKVCLAGKFNGQLKDFKGKNVLLEWGNKSKLAGDIHLTGLPRTKNLGYELHLETLQTDAADIEALPSYPFDKGIKMSVPKEIKALQTMIFEGDVSGTLDSVETVGKFSSSMGEFTANLKLAYEERLKDYVYLGTINCTDLSLGTIIQVKPRLGRVSGEVFIKGQSFDRNKIEAFIRGKIAKIELDGYPYSNIDASGTIARNVYDGKFTISDPNVNLSFNGFADLSKLNSRFDFSASIQRINLNALHFVKRDDPIVISAEINSEFSGTTIDNLFGQIECSEASIAYGKETYYIDDFLLEAEGSAYERKINLYSNLLDARIKGAFKLEELPEGITDLLSKYLPSYTLLKSSTKAADFIQNFVFDIQIKDIDVLQKLYFPFLDIEKGSHISGKLDTQREFIQINAEIPEITVSGIRIKTMDINSTADNRNIGFKCSARKVELNDSIFFNHVSLNSEAIRDSMDVHLLWASRRNLEKADAQLNTRLNFYGDTISAHLLPSILLIKDTLWQVNDDNKLIFSKNKLDVKNLFFVHNQEFIRANGTISQNPKDEIDLILDNFRLENLNPFIPEEDISIGGYTKGIVTVSNVLEKPLLSADLELNKIKVNNDLIGDGKLRSKWDPEKNSIEVNGFIGTAEIKKVDFNGFIYPDKTDDVFDLSCSLKNLRIDILKPYVSDIFSDITGLLDGKIKVTGSPAKPVLDGELSFDKRTFVVVDVLNTKYQVLDKVILKKNIIQSKTLQLRDKFQNEARCDLKITHDYFKDWKLDIKIDFQNMQALNTNESQNSSFFGTAFGTGSFRAYGPVDNIVMDIKARTEKGTVFNLPLSGTSDVNQYDFVTFRSANKTNAAAPPKKVSNDNASGYALNFDLEVTPDAEMRLLFDPKVGDILTGNGTSNLRLEYNENGDFNVFGDYNIDKGEYLFTLQNVINKKFIVQKGGKISFGGDPYNADINLTATYRVRTPLYQLVKNIDSSATVKRPIDVDAMMMLSDKLMQPQVNFDILLPNSDEATRNLLKSQIVNEDDLNRQVFSLLVFRTFLPNQSGVANASAISNVGSNVSELLSSQLTNMLSQISNDVNLGVNYMQGDATSADQVNVNLSTQLFNDRVAIDGSVGTGNTSTSSVTNTSGMVGEFNIEVKVTEDGAVRIKAFNRSNQYLLVTNDVPYTQGVGIFYRREFDDWKEFKSRSKSKIVQ
ncbi:MAG: translocation/assembly module TamB domain-containing protein [Bacteroidia bacterium]